MVKVLLSGKTPCLRAIELYSIKPDQLTASKGGSGFIAAHIVDVLVDHGYLILSAMRLLLG